MWGTTVSFFNNAMYLIFKVTLQFSIVHFFSYDRLKRFTFYFKLLDDRKKT